MTVASAKHLDRRFTVEHGRDDIAVLGVALLTHHNEVAVADRGVDH